MDFTSHVWLVGGGGLYDVVILVGIKTYNCIYYISDILIFLILTSPS